MFTNLLEIMQALWGQDISAMELEKYFEHLTNNRGSILAIL